MERKTEAQKKHYYCERWVAEQVSLGKVQCGEEKVEKLKKEFPWFFKKASPACQGKQTYKQTPSSTA